ncbi:MAG: histidinol-phosphate transaminase [Candidatus Omnitrophota bacterium]|jgi:histidinol-phosphate aminotransferase
MNSFVRKNIADLTPYKAGKPIEETKRELKLSRIIKLASNENPLGPSPKAVLAIKRNLLKINRYPDSQSFYLRKNLAKKLAVLPENIVLGNGSDEVIDIIIKTFVNDDENIITSKVTFLEYEIIAKVNAKLIRTIPLKDFKYDLEAITRAVNKKTKLIFIANPNNPTGTYITKSEFERFLAKIPQNVIVVLDQAYDLFIDVNDYPDSLDYIKKNVIILKTFSKAYGLAGLRIGYAIANTRLTPFMEKTRQPFNINMLAQQAASAALQDKEFLRKTRQMTLEGKQYLYNALDQMGLRYIPSVANFILIDVAMDGVTLFQKLLKKGVIIRDMQQYGLRDFIRVSIGSLAENRIFIKRLKEIL